MQLLVRVDLFRTGCWEALRGRVWAAVRVWLRPADGRLWSD